MLRLRVYFCIAVSHLVASNERWHQISNDEYFPHPFLLTHWGWDKMANIFQTAILNMFSWIKMYEIPSKFNGSFFSCDQAALRTLLSVRPSVRLSVCLSVCLSHLFHYVIVSSWNFQDLLPLTKVTSLQNVMVKGQSSRSQRSWPHFAVSGP